MGHSLSPEEGRFCPTFRLEYYRWIDKEQNKALHGLLKKEALLLLLQATAGHYLRKKNALQADDALRAD